MTYNEKRSIYESIMKQISADVKRQLNEDDNSDEELKMKRQNMI